MLKPLVRYLTFIMKGKDMPCSDGRDDYYEMRDDYNKLSKELGLIEAFLCGVLTVIENRGQIESVFNAIDLNEGGFNQSDIETWWKKHKKEDELRRAKERAKIEAEISELEKSINQDNKMLEQLKRKLK